MKPSYLIAIAGGSCSGKTTLAHRLADLARAGDERSTLVIGMDAYYKDQSGVPLAALNVDTPEAIDHKRLDAHLSALAAGRRIEMPVYDYRTHARAPTGEPVAPADVIILEGLFALYWPPIRERMRTKLFVDVSRDVALARRIARDVKERGRTEAEVMAQFDRIVMPMYEVHVRPTRGHADRVLDGDRPVDELAHAALELMMND